MAEGKNQTGQVGAGQAASTDRASLDVVTAGVKEVATQLSEQIEKIKSAAEQLGQQLSTTEQTRHIEEIKAAADEIERLAPLAGIADQLPPRTKKIKDAVEQL